MKIQDKSMHPYTYEVVEEVPLGYHIWNIGKQHAPEGYLPFCRLSSKQPFPGGRSIEVDTLKALKCEGWDIILDAIGYGPQNSTEMKKYIEKSRKNPNRNWICQYMRDAIPYLEKIGL